MERETKIITTPLGHAVKIKAFFTQSERVQVQKILAGNNTAKESGAEEGTKISDLLEAQTKAVQLALVSINDDAKDPFDQLTNNLPASEYDAVAKVVIEMIKVDLETAK